MSQELSAAQRAALHHVREVARRRRAEARDRLSGILQDADCMNEEFDEAVESIRAHARIVLHFHPDRFGLKPKTVAESLLDEGFYRNQFETGLSSGSRTAFFGGDRDQWEKDLFGGVYQNPFVVAAE